MTVEVKTHRRVGPQLARWVRTLPGPPADRAALAAASYHAMLDALRRSAGRLDGAVAEPGVFPPTFTCRFAGGWVLRYQVRTTRRLFRRRVVVMVVGLAPGPLGGTGP